MIRMPINSKHEPPLLQSASHPGSVVARAMLLLLTASVPRALSFGQLAGVVRNTGFTIVRIFTLLNDGSAGDDNRVGVINTEGHWMFP